MIIWKNDGKGGLKSIFKHDCLDGFPDVAVGDINKDGIDEVIVDSIRGGAYLVKPTLSGEFETEKLGDYERTTKTVIIGDVLNDGSNRVVVLEDGAAFRGPPPAKIHVYGNKNGVWPALYGTILDAVICDIDGDGQNELLSLSRSWSIAVSKYTAGSGFKISDVLCETKSPNVVDGLTGNYQKVCGFEKRALGMIEINQAQEIVFGDLVGDGSRCILLPGFDGRFQVIRHQSGKFATLFTSEDVCGKTEKDGNYLRSCAIGDLNNDGKNEAVVGAKNIMAFGYDGHGFKKLWESPMPSVIEDMTSNINSICIADIDGDSMNELLFSEPAGLSKTLKRNDGASVRINKLVVMKNSSKGNWDLKRAWESDPYPGHFRIAVGNCGGK